MPALEDTARLDIAQLRQREEWAGLVHDNGGAVLLETPDGQRLSVKVELICERAGWRTRHWLRCEGCGQRRRRHLYLQADRLLRCRECFRPRLHYAVQLIPDAAFRRDTARPLLAALRRD